MKKKVFMYNPGDDVNINLHFKCNKLSLLKIEVIELDNFFIENINDVEL